MPLTLPSTCFRRTHRFWRELEGTPRPPGRDEVEVVYRSFELDPRAPEVGAQPVEVFTEVLERAWAESRPALKLV